MTERVKFTRNRDATDISDHLICKNVSGEAIPAYGCVKLTAFSDVSGYYDADKPDGDDGLHYVNGPVAVPAAAYFRVSLWNRPRVALLLDGAFGEEVGPVAGEWEMAVDSPLMGYRLIANRDLLDRAAVVQLGGGGGSGTLDVIPTTCIGDGYYTAEIGIWAPDIPVDGVCDLCELLTLDPEATIDDVSVAVTRDTLTGTGVMVTIYDPFPLPLKLEGGHAIVSVPAEVIPAVTTSGAEADAIPVYRVLNGNREVIRIPHSEWECCVDPTTGATTVTRVRYAEFLVVGVPCIGPLTPCPTSGSGGSGDSGSGDSGSTGSGSTGSPPPGSEEAPP